MPDAHQPWRLERAEERLDLWILQESPPQDLLLLVLAWILSRAEDPFAGLRRVEGFENYWFGVVPGSDDGKGQVVTCALWISEVDRTVRFDLFATSGWPA